MAEPKHGTQPIVVEETAGKKAYCICGWSEKLPHCDGAHNRQQTGCAPIVLELSEAGRKAVCQCHKSGNMPWCDGTHAKLAS